jgi:hypothetical protein
MLWLVRPNYNYPCNDVVIKIDNITYTSDHSVKQMFVFNAEIETQIKLSI